MQLLSWVKGHVRAVGGTLAIVLGHARLLEVEHLLVEHLKTSNEALDLLETMETGSSTMVHQIGMMEEDYEYRLSESQVVIASLLTKFGGETELSGDVIAAVRSGDFTVEYDNLEDRVKVKLVALPSDPEEAVFEDEDDEPPARNCDNYTCPKDNEKPPCAGPCPCKR